MQSVNLKKDSYEIIEMRTEHQKVFKLSNGNYKYQIYSNPIHYFDGEMMVELDDQKDSTSKRTYKNSEKIEKEKVTTEELRKYARGEITHAGLLHYHPLPCAFECYKEERYNYRLEDIYSFLLKYSKKELKPNEIQFFLNKQEKEEGLK